MNIKIRVDRDPPAIQTIEDIRDFEIRDSGVLRVVPKDGDVEYFSPSYWQSFTVTRDD